MRRYFLLRYARKIGATYIDPLYVSGVSVSALSRRSADVRHIDSEGSGSSGAAQLCKTDIETNNLYLMCDPISASQTAIMEINRR